MYIYLHQAEDNLFVSPCEIIIDEWIAELKVPMVEYEYEKCLKITAGLSVAPSNYIGRFFEPFLKRNGF